MAGLHLHSGNRLERLADALVGVARAPLSSPFAEETVLVQSLGMARWLKLELATRLGVAAGFQFPFPRAFALELFRAAGVKTDQQPSFDPRSLTWRVFSLLPQLASQPEFEPIARYLADGDGRKRFQLSAKIAAVFDQYLTYRPDMIRAWESAKGGAKAKAKADPLLKDDDQWQPLLWRAVCKDWGDGHPAKWREVFLKAVKDGRIDRALLPERLCVFGVSALPPLHLELISALSSLIPVHIFQLRPSLHYTGDLLSHREQARLRQRDVPLGAGTADEIAGHRLVASLGRSGREFLKLLYGQDGIEEEEHFESFAESAEAPATEEGAGAAPPLSLLQSLQRDLLALQSRAPDEPKIPVAANDDSIRVHSCHSPIREAEVLRDHLLKWFTDDPSLQPRDIVVMVPDLPTYAPAIEAALGTPERPEEAIPFTISDRSPRDQGALAALWQALELLGGRFAAPEVVALLERDAVRSRAGFQTSDLDSIRAWLAEAEIRVGLDAPRTAAFHGEPLNTWAAGLRRLQLGYCVAGEGPVAVRDTVRPTAVEGSDAAVLGRLCEAVERLANAATAFAFPASPKEWAQRLRDFAEAILGRDAIPPREQETLRAALASLVAAEEHATCTEPLDFATVLEHLGPVLGEDRHGSGYLAGAITVCGLKPMRSIPFRVVCLLGMNDGAFPRRNVPLSFDLTTRERRDGDSSPRDDDRQLFLETLVSARTRLHLSYVGQSQHHGQAAPPSVVVSELLDALEHDYCGQEGASLRDQLVVKHRLQAFSPAYFSGGPLFSFSRSNFYAARQSTDTRSRPKPPLAGETGEPVEGPRHVSLDDLVRFFRNPPRWFAERRLKLHLPSRADVLADAERFETGALDQYDAKSALLEVLVATVDAPPVATPPVVEAPTAPEPTAETPSANEETASFETAAPAQAECAIIPEPVAQSHSTPAISEPPTDPALVAVALGHLETWRRAGRLPSGLVGQSEVKRLALETVRFWSQAAGHLGPGAIRQVEATLELGDATLHGRVTLRGNILVRIRPAKVKATDRLRAWLEHLFALVATGEAIRTVLVGLDDVVEFGETIEPREVLKTLVDLYFIGQTGPLPFMPETCFAYIQALQKNPDDTEKALFAARQRWLGDETGFGPKGERLDDACRLAFTDRNLTEEPGFLELTAAVFRIMAIHGKDSSR